MLERDMAFNSWERKIYESGETEIVGILKLPRSIVGKDFVDMAI